MSGLNRDFASQTSFASPMVADQDGKLEAEGGLVWLSASPLRVRLVSALSCWRGAILGPMGCVVEDWLCRHCHLCVIVDSLLLFSRFSPTMGVARMAPRRRWLSDLLSD
jgi:hypothetical protein